MVFEVFLLSDILFYFSYKHAEAIHCTLHLYLFCSSYEIVTHVVVSQTINVANALLKGV